MKDRIKNLPENAKLAIDATEQQIQRPSRKQRCYYSGKKHKHTIGTQIVSDLEGKLILHVSASHPGKVHDYKIFKQSKLGKSLKSAADIYLDSGYQGIQRNFPNLNTHIPHKKSKNKKLTKRERRENRELSSQRISIEHRFAEIKKYRVLSETYRIPKRNYNQDFRNVVSLVNFRKLHQELAS